MENARIDEIIDKSDDEKINILKDNKFIEDNNINNIQAMQILFSLSDEAKEELSVRFLYRLGVSNEYMILYFNTIENDNIKLNLLLKYNLKDREIEMIAKNLKDENKITLLINKKLGEHAILVIITSMKEIKNIIVEIPAKKVTIKCTNLSC